MGRARGERRGRGGLGGGRWRGVVGVVMVAGVVAGCTSGTTSASGGRPSAGESAPSGAPSGPDTVEVSVSTLATGLDVPWGLAPLDDGSVLVTLRDAARLVVVTPDGAVRDVAGPGADQLEDVVQPQGEGGLLGVAVLGESDEGIDLALYATAAGDNRVLRGTLRDRRLGELTAVLTGIPAARNHDGGRLAVGPDGFLYVSTGDAGDVARAQDPADLGGKILRVTADGRPAPGNPDPDSPVWSLGHRNVQGLGWVSDGRMFASEFGQNTFDEVNVIHPGGNYGWPEVEGEGGADEGFVDPVAVWATADASPSGLAVTDEAVYVAGLRGERLWRVPLRPAGATDADGVGEPQALLTGEHGRLRAVAVAADGSLLVATNNTDGRGDPRPGDDRILRVVVR
ncbi:glucose sorbosone dehydrogenase [Cellulomonas sp. A375-1]|nr:glucose sorbosone dehydrogenase [Cellulomonas sp. A375-1]